MISFDEAVALVIEAARPLGRGPGTVLTGAGASPGRVAASVIAAVDCSPPADDVGNGWLCRRGTGTCRAHCTTLIGRSFPGISGFTGVIGAGQSVQIFTGAPIPVRRTPIA